MNERSNGLNWSKREKVCCFHMNSYRYLLLYKHKLGTKQPSLDYCSIEKDNNGDN
jgi:hypothetical protein